MVVLVYHIVVLSRSSKDLGSTNTCVLCSAMPLKMWDFDSLFPLEDFGIQVSEKMYA